MKWIFFCGVFLVVSFGAYGGVLDLREKIEKIGEGKELKLGVALYDFDSGDELYVNGDDRFPMQSVFKFPIALTVLNEVDNGKFGLHDDILIQKSDIIADLWSPIREKYPLGDVRLPLSEIVRYTVALSDNVGCDLLLKMLGGAHVVNDYIHGVGVSNISIKNNEQEIQAKWSVQFDNWVTPKAMIELLRLFNDKKLLSPVCHDFLWKTMVGTSTGSIKNRLPSDAIVAHKTGTSGYNRDKVSAATNDVGVMVLPSGKRVAFVIFVTESRESAEINARVIADIGEVIYFSEN